MAHAERPDHEAMADDAMVRGQWTTARHHLEAAAHGAPDDVGLHLKLASACRAAGDPLAARRAIDVVLALQPLNFVALLFLATLFEQSGNGEQAAVTYGRALANAPDPPPPGMDRVLAKARAMHAQWQQRTRDMLRDRARAADAMTPRLDRFISNAVRLTVPDRDGPTHYCFPDLATQDGFYPRSHFPWLASLEQAWTTIRSELHAVLTADPDAGTPYIDYPAGAPIAQWRELNHNRDWSAIHLIQAGTTTAQARQHCPATLNLLATLPQPAIPGVGPNAMFSLLAPGTHIPAHTGVNNARLVCHLPLIVPTGCRFRVGKVVEPWVEGRAWVFDDTIEHEAFNDADAPRAILLFDLWHPDLDAVARRGIAAVVGAGATIHAL